MIATVTKPSPFHILDWSPQFTEWSLNYTFNSRSQSIPQSVSQQPWFFNSRVFALKSYEKFQRFVKREMILSSDPECPHRPLMSDVTSLSPYSRWSPPPRSLCRCWVATCSSRWSWSLSLSAWPPSCSISTTGSRALTGCRPGSGTSSSSGCRAFSACGSRNRYGKTFQKLFKKY